MRRCVAASQGRAGGVSRLIARNSALYSGGEDEAIRAWSLDANECVATWRGRAGAVDRLIARDSALRSGGEDEAIRAWQL